MVPESKDLREDLRIMGASEAAAMPSNSAPRLNDWPGGRSQVT
jgi:hypothetical protein